MKILKKLTVLVIGVAIMLQTMAVSALSGVKWTQVFDGVWEYRTQVNLGDGIANAVVIKAAYMRLQLMTTALVRCLLLITLML